MRIKHHLLAIAVAAASIAGVLTATNDSPAAAVPATIPPQITNNSPRGPGVRLQPGDQPGHRAAGWADAANAFAWPAGVADARAGRVDRRPGQRAVAHDPDAEVLRPGVLLVRPEARLQAHPPADWCNPPYRTQRSDRNILFNWSEYTLNDAGLWINSTQVDMFSALHAVEVQLADGTTKTTGHLKPGGYNGFFDALRGQPGGWANLIQTAPNGSVLAGALAPVRR